MLTRCITGFCFVLVVLAAIFIGRYVSMVFFLVLIYFCLQEFYRLISTKAVRPQRTLGRAVAMALCICFFANLLWGVYPAAWTWVAICGAVAIIVSELYRETSDPFHNIAYTLFGILFIVAPFCLLVAIGFLQGSYDPDLIFAFFLLLWSNDTGAYFVGKVWGKTRLFERHSPKKTWEGYFGGLCAALLVAMALSCFLWQLSTLAWMGMALIIAVVGTYGDLVESMLKRSLLIKDSGNFLPGHGGLLDRFDGLFLSAPLIYLYLDWLI